MEVTEWNFSCQVKAGTLADYSWTASTCREARGRFLHNSKELVLEEKRDQILNKYSCVPSVFIHEMHHRDFVIDSNELEPKERHPADLIGQGTFGEVYKGWYW
jgi:hypothetical protein